MHTSSSLSAALVMVLSAAFPAIADIVPVSGTQSSIGHVSVITPPDDPIEGSYALTAPDALASWSPEDQHLTRVINTDRYAEARINSSFGSTIALDHVALGTSVSSAALTGSPFNSGASIEYTQTFHFSFSLSAPTTVSLAAQIGRNNGGWTTPTPFSLSFGRQGDAPIIAFAYATGSADQYLEFLPETEMVLAPGTYDVMADNYNFWGAGRGGQFYDFMSFDLRVIPAPASVFPMSAGLLSLCLRRHRKD